MVGFTARYLNVEEFGLTMMTERYLSGGAPADVVAPAIVGIGVLGLFGLLFIGRFFGRLSTASALAMLLAPLLCWATEAPFLRERKPWLVGSLRLALVAIPLAVVLVAAKREFDRDMAPLLTWNQSASGTCR